MRSIREYQTALNIINDALSEVEDLEPYNEEERYPERRQRVEAMPRYQELNAIRVQLIDAAVDAIKAQFSVS